jgi:hypothetical protein
MPSKASVYLKFILGNFIPLLQIAGLIAIFWVGTVFSIWTFIGIFIWIYILPPVLVRLIYFQFGRPSGTYRTEDRLFWVWYFGSQLQALYLRFPFLEEMLRLVPLFYSNWLKLWGSKIGKNIFWAPQVIILDRTHLEIQDEVIVGFGAVLTAHLLNQNGDEIELVLASPRVERRAVLGGQSAISSGSLVCEAETLPATIVLTPFYVWKNGRRQPKLK